MKFKNLTYASIITCFLSFLSLLFCAFLSPVDSRTKEWFVACFFCFIISFISSRILRKKENHAYEEQSEIGESSFERGLVAMILWAPVLLALYAITGILFINLNFEKVGWVLVVLAGNTGFQAAKLPFFSSRG